MSNYKVLQSSNCCVDVDFGGYRLLLSDEAVLLSGIECIYTEDAPAALEPPARSRSLQCTAPWRTTTPSFITSTGCSVTRMSVSGLPGTATMSASLPSWRVPTRSKVPSRRAAFEVPA